MQFLELILALVISVHHFFSVDLALWAFGLVAAFISETVIAVCNFDCYFLVELLIFIIEVVVLELEDSFLL